MTKNSSRIAMQIAMAQDEHETDYHHADLAKIVRSFIEKETTDPDIKLMDQRWRIFGALRGVAQLLRDTTGRKDAIFLLELAAEHLREGVDA